MPTPVFEVTITPTDDLDLVSQEDRDELSSLVKQAAELWGRYIDSEAEIEIGIEFMSLGETTLATAGPSNNFSVSQTDGVTVFEALTVRELRGASDLTDGPDIFVTINIDFIDQFFKGDQSEGAVIPSGQFDFQTILVHELGHGLGLVAFSDDGTPGSNQTTFETFLEQVDGTLQFTGDATVAVNGGPLLIDEDGIHPEAGDFIMSATLRAGLREFISPTETAILQDIGVPLLTATDGDDRLFGYSGVDDSLVGGFGDDVLFGLSGNDMIEGESGVDRLRGDAGDDTLFGGSEGDTLSGGDGADLLIGGFDADIAFAGAGNDIIVGFDYGAGPDILFVQVVEGSESDAGDTIFGGGGDDIIIAGRWYDENSNSQVDDGELGLASDSTSNILYAGTGDDEVYGAAGGDTLGGGVGDDTIMGAGGNDTVFGGQDQADTGANDVIDGGDGADIIFASAGNDVADGGDGSDSVFGGAGNDTLGGGAGTDEIFGGGGDDQLTGGAGADSFFFANSHGADTITDFDVNEDVLVLANASTDFGSASDVQAASSETSVDGESGVLIETGGGTIFVQGISLSDITDNILVL